MNVIFRSALLALLVAADPAFAQSGATGVSSASVVAPSASGGQVSQPPQNSAMRNSATGSQSRAVGTGANPMGMAGMGSANGMSANALTLGSASGMGGAGQGGSMGQQTMGSADQAQGAERVTDTGITQRTPPTQSGSH